MFLKIKRSRVKYWKNSVALKHNTELNKEINVNQNNSSKEEIKNAGAEVGNSLKI